MKVRANSLSFKGELLKVVGGNLQWAKPPVTSKIDKLLNCLIRDKETKVIRVKETTANFIMILNVKQILLVKDVLVFTINRLSRSTDLILAFALYMR